ncbi:endo-1,4-beta-xylanase [Pirellulimonas nuda]|nr:endo-1,4-beta-xylanase [Pirellulimonas nuda]
MRFVVHDRAQVTQSLLARTFAVSGQEEVPYLGRTYLSGDLLVVERRDDSSGSVHVPWNVPKFGVWQLATASLMEREKPYLLELELARGTVFRLRNQLGSWQLLGLEAPEEVTERVAEATRAFSRAATNQDNPAEAARYATEAMAAAAAGSVALADTYGEQAIRVRAGETEKLGTLLGVRLSDSAPEGAMAERIAEACNIVAAPLAWKSVEATEGKRRWKACDEQVAWAHQHNMKVIGGPLLEFDERSLPEWSFLWEGDYSAVASLMMEHVRTTVQRFRGRIHLWNVAARVNHQRVLGLTDEQRLQVVARAVREVRAIDTRTPIVVSFDEPWAEYMAHQPAEMAPLDFADQLERADLGISGFGVELNAGFHPFGTAPRNPLAFSRLIDQWSQRLELPLLVMVSAPSSASADPMAPPKVKVVAGGEGRTIDADYQADWARRRLPMLLAKNCVQIVLWNTLADDRPHDFPNAGLFDSTGAPKPVLGVLRDVREKYLT